MSAQPEYEKRPQWRRKWRPRPAEERQSAASSLRDLFAPAARTNRVLAVLLCLSLLAHVATVPIVIRQSGGVSREQVVKSANAYLRKVMQKELGKKIAKDIEKRITMPPPPPEPEGVVQKAMTQAVVGDIDKLTANLLSVDVRTQLTAFVEANLKRELAVAAANIVQGKLSQEEIAKLHKQFEEEAAGLAKQWRQGYMEEHQIQRAAVSTTEWYESDVAHTLFGNLAGILDNVWHHFYVGGYGWGTAPNWSNVHASHFMTKLAGIDGLLSGQWHDAGGKGKDRHPAWPGPNRQQAEALQAGLKGIWDGNPSIVYPTASWKTAVYGGTERPAMTTGMLREFHAHRLDEMKKYAGDLDALWEKVLAEADEYAQKAASGVEEPALAAAQTACFNTLKQIRELAGKFSVRDPRPYEKVNWALRTQVLMSPERDKAYAAWVNAMTQGLEPMIRDFARGQFKNGIIKHKAGVDEAMKEFPATIVPLLRRDVMALLPKVRFDEKIFDTIYPYKEYRSPTTGRLVPPTQKDLDKELAEMKGVLDAWPKPERAYAVKRRDLLGEDFHAATARVPEELLSQVLTGNLLTRQRAFERFVEGVDYADPVQEKLDARQAAMQGRGQDLAKLTPAGVPDTSAPLVAMMFGASKGQGASLTPCPAGMQPAFMAAVLGPDLVMRGTAFVSPPNAAPWGTVGEQASVGVDEKSDVKPKFGNILRTDGIPFLPRFPKLDGDLSDWGKIRPLRLGGGAKPLLLYAAWNYQGFFFGYHVEQPTEQFYYPSLWQMGFNHNTGGMSYQKREGAEWAFTGDNLQLLFDTLDARNVNRGEPHAQEFVILPDGSDSDRSLPGCERVIASQRDAKTKQYRGVKSSGEIFPAQPPPESGRGPDGSGPYRVTQKTQSGYTTEVFVPRSLFKVPVFAPGWYIGFDAVVAAGPKAFRQTFTWADGRADQPNRWGDLLLLGTDPQIVIQEASAAWKTATHVIPGHSYLVTVADPDRNVDVVAEDTVLVSAEVIAGASRTRDVEVFVLKETGPNTGVFRGCVDTQPGEGRQVQGVLEVKPTDVVRLGYVDFANAKGQRNVINEIRLPVVALENRIAAANAMVAAESKPR